ncbi:MAG TPA: ATP-binding protein [Candidatus Saccharimonadales bacterium]
MLKGVSQRTRLTVIFLVLLAILGSIGLYQTQSIRHVQGLFADTINHDLPRQNKLHEMKTAAHELENTTILYNQARQGNEAQQVQADIENQAKNLTKTAEAYQSLISKDAHELDAPTVIQTLAQNVQAVTQATTETVEAVDKNPAQATHKQTALLAAVAQLSQHIDNLLEIEAKTIKNETEDASSSATRLEGIVWLSMVSALLAAAIYGILSFFLSRSVRQLQQGAERIANGDFSRRIRVSSMNQEVWRLANTFNNMSDRLRDSYRRLSVETERDRIMLESLGEGVIAIDEHRRITLINAEAIALLELEEQSQLIGKAVEEILSLLDEKNRPLAPTETPVAQVLKNNKTIRGTYHYQKKTGAKIIIDLSTNPVMVEGKLSGAVMNLRDVTKEREVDRMKTEFISLASHQLRTPLSAIKWFSEMLVAGDAGELKPEQADFARNIADSTERMIALVNALLNISRIESGRIMIDPKPTDLRELVSGIVNDLKAKTEEKKQTLIISVHEDLPKIKLDPRLISQVYMNLLSNAIKYTQKGGEVSVFISKKDNDVISQVTDNGYGIPKEQQGRIFQKFFRAANAVKVETDGTGLGLYLIKAVIESSGGKIWFESEEGKGTTFWFSIPLSGMKAKEGEVTLDV